MEGQLHILHWTFDGSVAHFAVALCGMPIACGEQPTGSGDGQIEDRTCDEFFTIEIAASDARRLRAVLSWLGGWHPHHSHERSQGDLMSQVITPMQVDRIKLPQVHHLSFGCFSTDRPAKRARLNGFDVDGKCHARFSPTNEYRTA